MKILTVAAAFCMSSGIAVAEDIDSNSTSETGDIAVVTIWMDADSEYIIREALAGYVYAAENCAGTEYEDYFPEVSWNLVDKSYLTQEEYKWEMIRALEEGAGPDLIYMDGSNGISSEHLMESGYLLELGDVTRYTVGRMDYLPGTLEAGQIDGVQYVLPVFIECPYVFGIEESLAEAGLSMEEGYGTLAEFLKALLEAAEKTGKGIFEDASAVDWIRENCIELGTEGSESDTYSEGMVEEVEHLLDEVRAHSGDNDSYFSPYETLCSGEYLLSGGCLSDRTKAVQNLSLLGEEAEVGFLTIPSLDGEIRAVITQSAAVNANTAFPKEASALVRAFQNTFVNYAWVEGMPAAGTNVYWNYIFDPKELVAETLDASYARTGERLANAGKTSRGFLACTKKAVTDASFSNRYAKDGKRAAEEPTVEKKEVLTVAFCDLGMGEEHPVYQWLKTVSEEYSESTLHIQLVPIPFLSFSIALWVNKMEYADSGVDILLDSDYNFAGSYHKMYGEWYTELYSLLEDYDEEFETVELAGKIRGLAYGSRESEKTQSGEETFVFAISEKCERKEEALAFCVLALNSAGYEEAMQVLGLTPVSCN